MWKQEAKDFVINYFKNKGLPEFDKQADLLECEYLEQGIIDSLGIVELITTIENEFSIVFSFQDMESSEFTTIGGLIAIIKRLLKEKE